MSKLSSHKRRLDPYRVSLAMEKEQSLKLKKVKQQELVDKWKKTGLLEALKTNDETSNLSVLVESQSKELV